MARKKITGNDIQNSSIVDANIDTVSGSKLSNSSVSDAKISDVSGSKLTNGTVTNAKISDVDGSKLTNGTVSDAKIATGISGSKISDGTIAAAKMASGALPSSLASTSFTTNIILLPLLNPDFAGGSLTSWSNPNGISASSNYFAAMGSANLNSSTSISQSLSSSNSAGSKPWGGQFLIANVVGSGPSPATLTLTLTNGASSVATGFGIGFNSSNSFSTKLSIGGQTLQDVSITLAASGAAVAATGVRIYLVA